MVVDNLPADPILWCKSLPNRPKIIHDSLWGTFELKAHEVALIDTPLIQRLRFIHQTGAVYLTYPSALHTRFEHTLGVMHQASLMCKILRERRGDSQFGVEMEDNLRMAALLHDTGHGPFSHTSEQYFSSLKSIAKLKETEAQFKESGAGEILSSIIIDSEPFRKFIRAINTVFGKNIEPDTLVKMITGTLPPDQLYRSEIIHGPLDADKLDYMHRDGMFSGLKMHVDLDRLYASIDTHSDINDPLNTTRIVGSTAGTSPLTQIMFNKMLLFTGIYHHHKVRAVDCMLWAIFDLAFKRKKKLGGRLIKTPADFLKLTDDLMLIPELTNDNDIKELIVAIRNRRLWKRALTISRRTATDEMVDAKSNKGPFTDFALLQGDEREKIEERRRISDLIWEESKAACKIHEVWLDVPKLPSMNEAARMWIKAPGQAQPETLRDFVPVEQWVELYGTHKWRAHVFCPEAARNSIADAAIAVLRREIGLELKSSARQPVEAT
ncbi:MAG TPA: HD domain-containing protein [Tepidisphaeraceae bacterium]